ncbi:hypothetical protein BAUCODRAFT_120256 [Baudoinia panamericana UAMH 10762]|uniref:Major facilitator superfamily (MFS) profile domain-containing protein n=1 Tax=Baudoinia panamericana (strain UAMH 10762) TaxID=717646 RepID=M2NHY2_BAUPA|nr:uncharacterized protein BAUCODRAFT_120256 [Baudoinia panamericana UAMH 10762]EMC98964.1 hypothetical protein BAUCODRAFT_120256 [Baudoinia panamericana UAMH 10762]
MEKTAPSAHTAPHDTVSSQDVEVALRRVDGLVLLPLVFMFVFLQFDRTNLGNALTDTLRKDAHLTQADINLGQTLFTLGIVLWELPSNVIIKRVGAHRWLPLLMFCWGTVTWSQTFITSRRGFLTTRFLLATFEAGFIPGAAFYLGQFVTRRELAFRYALLWAANSVAGALGGVLALGLLSLSGKHGVHGWQYLFAIEGALTCFVAVLMALHLPQSPIDASKRHRVMGSRWTILKPDQGAMLQRRAMQDDPSKKNNLRRVTIRDFDILLDHRIYGHLVMAFLSSVMFSPINTYAPSIIKALGYRGYSANGMNAVGSACNLLVALPLAYFSDRTRHRGLFVLTGFIISAVGLLWLALPPNTVSRGILYAGVIVTEAGMGSVQGINAAWLSENVQERQRPIVLGCYVMSIQLASFVGANLFKAADAPRYTHGLLVCAGCTFGAAAVSIIWTVLYKAGSRSDA